MDCELILFRVLEPRTQEIATESIDKSSKNIIDALGFEDRLHISS